jgi:23S rRNA pseudouridine955/2504/2580 synthase
MLSITITHPADSGQRIDRFVRKYLPNAPLGGIFKMLRTGKIKVNKKKKDQTYKIELWDEVTFWLTDEEMDQLKVESWKLKGDLLTSWTLGCTLSTLPQLSILYEDEYLMVVNKPPGINVHAGDHKTTESNIIDQVQDYLKWKYDSLTFRPALVHRIDRDTSGCLLIAKDKSVLESLLVALQTHQIEKVYHTIVKWTPTEPSGTIRARLLRITDAKNEAKVRVDEWGQSAVTHYRVVESRKLQVENTKLKNHSLWTLDCTLWPTFSLLECRIETGRTHQIRVHMAHIGHPIIGDRAYGDKSLNSYMRRELRIDRQLLHAYSLSFVHPKTNKKQTVIAPYPPDFRVMIGT